ncbi:YoaK family protein [uncultured Roseibium sp.]|uniref:YoaK family protein n=1 Tax=uncultured Roseibium sp. TaxID=1936171 RepID=UPI00260D06C1|nr:YoaK family protein [uncultured Roseibium sp.]
MSDTSPSYRSHSLVPVLLAFCACFVDVVCIIGLFHTFTAFISGTLVVLCVEVFHQSENALLKVFVLVTFLVFTLFWYVVVTRLIRRKKVAIGHLFALEACIVAAFMLVAGLGDPSGSGPLAPVTLVAVGLSTIAMTLQNVIMLTILNHHVPTTMMTGNSLKLVLGLADYFAHPESRTGSREIVIHQTLVISAFAVGGLLASFLFGYFGFWVLAIPVTVLLLLAVLPSVLEGLDDEGNADKDAAGGIPTATG